VEAIFKLGKLQHIALVADRLDVILVKVAGLEEGTLRTA
jgi:hypothetical protein